MLRCFEYERYALVVIHNLAFEVGYGHADVLPADVNADDIAR